MVHYHDLIAGEGEKGFRDGSFQFALFNEPQGLAINSDDTQLYVADKKNHSIRVIYLDQSNRVETLTGFGKPGYLDGPLTQALFKEPTALAFISANRLAVYDSGNSALRLVDLERKQVSTLPTTQTSEGKPPDIPFANLWNLLYSPADDSLYFSQPELGTLRKIDLKTGFISAILKNDPQVPKPAALCLYQGHICVANRDDLRVYQVDFKPDSLTPIVSAIINNSDGRHILAVASSGKNLYAVEDQSTTPWLRLQPQSPVNFVSVWGAPLTNFLSFDGLDCVGLVPDPHQERRFFIASSHSENVISLRDYDFEADKRDDEVNAAGLSDFDYPTTKPPNTFRILVVGDSLSFSTAAEGARWPWGGTRIEVMPKKVELMLNTEAALDDVPLNYEVLDIGHGSEGTASFLWPYYEVPDLVKKFDIDLVLDVFATVPTFGYSTYFLCPITKEGIPMNQYDPEYLLKPWKSRVPKGVAEDFLKKCMAKKWITAKSKTELEFARLNTTIQDKAIRNDLIELMGKPIGMLADKLKVLKTVQGQPVKYYMLLILSRAYEAGTLELYRDFWKTIAEKQKMPYLDMIDRFIAFTPTYYPLDENGSWRHYTSDGSFFYSYLMAHELVHNGIIPFPTPAKAVKDTQSPLEVPKN